MSIARLTVLVTTLLFSCALLAAQITPPKPGASPTVDRIRERGTLKAGATILAPWLLQDPNTGDYIGPAAVVAQQLAKALNVKLQYVDATWDTIVGGLVANKYDIADAALFETPQREKVISFVTFDKSGTCYVVRPDSKIHSLDDLNDPNLTYLGYTGYATDPLFHSKYPKTKMQQVSPPPGSGPRVPALLAGRGDIAPIDSPLVYWVHQKWPKTRIVPPVNKCFSHPDLVKPIGAGYPKGDKAFGKFLKQIVQANWDQIQAAKKRFSQPKWLNKH